MVANKLDEEQVSRRLIKSYNLCMGNGRLLGELGSMLTAFPGSQGLCSQLQLPLSLFADLLGLRGT
jgi:hypothetical protein